MYVKAVYEGNIESEAVSYTINGPALSTNEFTSKSFTVSPNPVKDILHISEEVSDISISDFSGKIVKQISTSKKAINLVELAKGTYIISATTKTGETVNKKFIKE
ncbi:T9SS type A sorting domain-containing protein [Epilithonimonas lactis]|uniref:T9SS type A sorting domain-containing protein n=1 Tax=Epilithonimonas lactis TaxID=421072 RepID=UPI0008AFBE73|nr:Por secretion system C-terminal sorting domain-containing protein [Epilithonimonas lactis]